MPEPEPVLKVRGLKVEFETNDGMVAAVRGSTST